ncbi:MAG TPA: hypothetical protein P5556_09025 [Candidatus Gastranaerophilales bacterium]|nr:hypothetical protein [Candidatus Gastranaerophilales bacterium]
MSEIDFKIYLNGVGNDLKIAIDDVIGIVEKIHDDVDQLKVKTSKPDKPTAQALLEYLAMEEGKAKQNLEILCDKQIKQYLKWIDSYCEEHNFSQEEVLNLIIKGEI